MIAILDISVVNGNGVINSISSDMNTNYIKQLSDIFPIVYIGATFASDGNYRWIGDLQFEDNKQKAGPRAVLKK